MLAILFDFSAMTPDDQSRARQAGLDFVRRTMKPTDSVALMTANNESAQVVLDFTTDRTVLETAITGLSAATGSGPGAAARLAVIRSAAAILSRLPEKKALMYISTGIFKPGADNLTEIQSTIERLKNANVAIYAVEVRGLTPQAVAPPAAAGVSTDEHNRRAAHAGEKFKSGAMFQAYVKYGPPDTIDDRGTSQIWRYNNLASFHNSAEFEFTPWNGHYNMRINWPPPVAVYQGVPSPANANGELPGHHASVQIYPAGESAVLSVPLESLSGKIELEGQIKSVPGAGAASRSVANFAGFRDNVQAAQGGYQANFILESGSYICAVRVTEVTTGKAYEETIAFDVK
jgi:hypothetical protein